MAQRDEPTLDEEGVPDLEGPLPTKALTGDPQEGVSPPTDRPRASVDWGTTADEAREGEPLDVRIARELPDEDEDPVDAVVADLGLDTPPIDEEAPGDDVLDRLRDALGDDAVDAGDADLRGYELVGDDVLDDEESEAVALALPTDAVEAQSPEESAMHVIDDDLA